MRPDFSMHDEASSEDADSGITGSDARTRNDHTTLPQQGEAITDDNAARDASGALTAARTFFQALVGDDGLAEGLWAHLWWRADRSTHWFQTTPDALRALTHHGDHDAYCGVGLAPVAGGPTDRVKVDTSAGMFGVVADIDIAGPTHKKEGLPPDRDAALALLSDIGLEPTMVVDSGHGLQAWWLFPTPWRFADDAERQRAVRLGKAWQDYVKTLAASHGWTIDSVGDLARVMRIAGTVNAKAPTRSVAVRLLRCEPRIRYAPEELEQRAERSTSLAHERNEDEDAQRARAQEGDRPATPPLHMLDDAALLQKIVSDPRHGANFFRAYYYGDITPWKSDDSAADMALVGELAYWCGPDPARIDHLFRQSALYRKPDRAKKWQAVHYANGDTYGQHLIATVLKERKRFATYTDWEEPVALPDELPPVAPFDSALLPEPLRPWLEDSARRIGAPLDFFGAPAMALAGSLIGRQIGIHPKRYDDWLVVGNVWGALVGLPASMKSPALNEVMKTLAELLAEADERYKTAQAQYEVALAQYEAQLAALKDLLKQAAKAVNNPSTQPAERAAAQKHADELKQQLALAKAMAPTPPVKARYKTEDTTIEKLGELLRDNPNGLLLHRDELMGWLRVLDERDHGKDRAFYLEAWEGLQGHEIDRIGRGSLYVPAVCMAVLGSIQPGPLSSYVRDALTTDEGADGFLQRFQVLVWPDAASAPGLDIEPDRRARAEAYRVFHALPTVSSKLHVPADTDDDSPIPAVRFTPEGQAMFDEWNAQLYARLARHDLHPAFEAHLTKYRSLMPSLALISQVVMDVAAGRPIEAVGGAAAEVAVRWCAYLETHARRLYGANIAPEVDGARSILAHIRAGDVRDGDTVRKVYLKHWRNADTPEKAYAALRVLEEYGWARTEKTPSAGGAPAMVIRINPLTLGDVQDNPDDEMDGKEVRA